MKGLLIKDYHLITQKKSTMIYYIFFAILFSFVTNGFMATAYLTMLGGFLSFNTLGYDEAENGYPFLMSLPVTAKAYAIEKHLFSALLLGLFWICAVILQGIFTAVRQGPGQFLSETASYSIYIPIFYTLISIMIPIELKFGLEKSRIVLLVFTGGLMAIFFIGASIIGSLPSDLSDLLPNLSDLPSSLIVAALLLLDAVIIAVCIACSIHIMEHKEY